MIAAALLACAIAVAPATMDKIIGVESGGNPLAVHVNGLVGPQPRPATVQEAAAAARRFIAAGYTVDLGETQVNSRNLSKFGLSIEDAFDECRNIATGGAILSGFYGRAVQQFGEGQRALMSALSGYNTGDLTRGFANGYVGKYYIDVALPASMLAVSAHTAPARPALPAMPLTVAYDRPGLDLRIN
jgi:type IV secretion system protein VirB1